MYIVLLFLGGYRDSLVDYCIPHRIPSSMLHAISSCSVQVPHVLIGAKPGVRRHHAVQLLSELKAVACMGGKTLGRHECATSTPLMGVILVVRKQGDSRDGC